MPRRTMKTVRGSSQGVELRNVPTSLTKRDRELGTYLDREKSPKEADATHERPQRDQG
jgi:hypothetical protein